MTNLSEYHSKRAAVKIEAIKNKIRNGSIPPSIIADSEQIILELLETGPSTPSIQTGLMRFLADCQAIRKEFCI